MKKLVPMLVLVLLGLWFASERRDFFSSVTTSDGYGPSALGEVAPAVVSLSETDGSAGGAGAPARSKADHASRLTDDWTRQARL
ncbi:MAG: hypothetical protein ACR2OZ_04340 [Verrucomicrobiales bacterium]